VFTGIIEHQGRLCSLSPQENGLRVQIEHSLGDLKPGESVAVDGVCLTVEKTGKNQGQDIAEFFLSTTTLEFSKFGKIIPETFHLERALRVGDRMGGHWVQGHVDGVAEVLEIHRQEEAWTLSLQVPASLSRYLIDQGSVTLDGVSLTVLKVQGTTFEVRIIPTTQNLTTFSSLSEGQWLNVEVDLVAKYVEKLCSRT